MNLTEHFSSNKGLRDQLSNKELARNILKLSSPQVMKDLEKVINAPGTLDELADALKVAEMIAEEKPGLIHFSDALFSLLAHTQNKIRWRAMCVLSNIAVLHEEEFHQNLNKIIEAMDLGSVITKDHGFKILVVLYQNPKYTSNIYPLLREQLLRAPDNQFGQYAEKWSKVVQKSHINELHNIILQRIPDLEKDSHIKRAQKIATKLLGLLA